MRWRLLGVAAAVVLWGTGPRAAPQIPPVPPNAAPTPIAAGAQVQSVQFTRFVTALEPGTEWGRMGDGRICEFPATLKWDGEFHQDLELTRFDRAFVDTMKASGFKVVGDPSDLFADASNSGDLSIAGRLVDLSGFFCEADGADKYKGRSTMGIEWQVYSPIKREVIARIRTRQGHEIPKMEEDGFRKIIVGAFAENVRALAASEEFRQLVLSNPMNAGKTVSPSAGLARVLLAGGAAAARSIPEASGVVVTVFSGGGHGSGFLVSQDGYLLTNQHVVGDARYVKVRWPDNVETVGEVIRTDRPRDVALIKTDARGRSPLALRRATLQPGETVFAIGTPLDAKFQNSVTRGVVSGARVFDGFNFIQSDVAITSGNSGGPLLDEKGAAVGITVSSYVRDNVGQDINLFIPIGDALDFLAADVR